MKYMECGFSKIRNRDEGGEEIKDHEVSKND